MLKLSSILVETYLSFLEEKRLDIDIPKDKFNNLRKEERDALYSIKNYNTCSYKRSWQGFWGCFLGQGRLFKRSR